MNLACWNNTKWDLSYRCTGEEHRIPPAIRSAPVSGQAAGCRAYPSQAPHRCPHFLVWSGWTLCCPHHQLVMRIEIHTKQNKGTVWQHIKSLWVLIELWLPHSGTNLNQLTHDHIFAHSIHIRLVPGGQSVDCNKVGLKFAVGVGQDSL